MKNLIYFLLITIGVVMDDNPIQKQTLYQSKILNKPFLGATLIDFSTYNFPKSCDIELRTRNKANFPRYNSQFIYPNLIKISDNKYNIEGLKEKVELKINKDHSISLISEGREVKLKLVKFPMELREK